jgi:hypothetical protein
MPRASLSCISERRVSPKSSGAVIRMHREIPETLMGTVPALFNPARGATLFKKRAKERPRYYPATAARQHSADAETVGIPWDSARKPGKSMHVSKDLMESHDRDGMAMIWDISTWNREPCSVREDLATTRSARGCVIDVSGKTLSPMSQGRTGVEWSERQDLNLRPPVPQTGALTGLRYAPKP